MPEYRGKDVLVRYDDAVCSHAGECVKALPQVFDVARTPWIDPDGATRQQLEAAVKRCPSGALSMERNIQI